MLEIQTLIRKAKLTPEEVEDLLRNKPVTRRTSKEQKQEEQNS